MRSKGLQLFFFLIALFIAAVVARAAQIYAFTLTDVDHNKLLTGDGHVTIIVVTKSTDTDKARVIADRVPDFCVGSPTHRFITILTFEQKYSAPTRMLLSLVARRRLDFEARRLQPRYTAKKLARNPRNDVFAVLDFEGTIARQLAVSAPFQVIILDREGELLKRWSDVPTTEQLATFVK